MWARFSAPVQTGPGAHPALCTMGTGSFSGGKERPGRDADPSPPSSAVVKKGQSYTSTPPMGRTACTEPQCLYKGALYLTLTSHLALRMTPELWRHILRLTTAPNVLKPFCRKNLFAADRKFKICPHSFPFFCPAGEWTPRRHEIRPGTSTRTAVMTYHFWYSTGTILVL